MMLDPIFLLILKAFYQGFQMVYHLFQYLFGNRPKKDKMSDQNPRGAEYIFPRPRKVSPRDGTEVKTCFICRGKVSFSAVVEKKDSCLTERSSCLTDRSSCLPERSEGRQRREVRQRSEVRQSF